MQKMKLFLWTVMLGAMVFTAVIPSAFAEDDKYDPCRVSSDKTAIPDTFNVRDCLTTSEQQDSQLIPKNASDPARGEQGPRELPNEEGIIVLLVYAIDLFVKIIGSVSLLVFIFGAVLAITAEGKEDRLTRGKDAMIYAVIGLAITMLSFVIVAFVQSIFY
ncbi:hypothetical protein KBD59_01240 [Candidatus Gracilibacteria bacterium]|nr:hypothetical protein [Candidatus Gracilibacteria bacterium]